MDWRLNTLLLTPLPAPSLRSILTPTVVVAGGSDSCLPSRVEAARLAALIPGAEVEVVEGAGHATTLGARCDLASVLRGRWWRELWRIPMAP